jgi:hypothetical protein
MAQFGRNESKEEATQRLRDNQYRGGRGYARHYYTVQDIARVAGRAVGTVRNDISKGRLIPTDLRSVAEYVLMRARDDA